MKWKGSGHGTGGTWVETIAEMLSVAWAGTESGDRRMVVLLEAGAAAVSTFHNTTRRNNSWKAPWW